LAAVRKETRAAATRWVALLMRDACHRGAADRGAPPLAHPPPPKKKEDETHARWNATRCGVGLPQNAFLMDRALPSES
jgi:hypothetical protein